MRRIIVYLHESEIQSLREAAFSDVRDIRDEARYLLTRALAAREREKRDTVSMTPVILPVGEGVGSAQPAA